MFTFVWKKAPSLTARLDGIRREADKLHGDSEEAAAGIQAAIAQLGQELAQVRQVQSAASQINF